MCNRSPTTLTPEQFHYGWAHVFSPAEPSALREEHEIEGRTHSLVIDDGWREVALTALAFLHAHGLRADTQQA